MQKQDVVAGCYLRGSGTDPAANVSLIQNLLSQETEAFHLLLINQHFLLPALITQGPLEKSEKYSIILQQIHYTEILNASKLHCFQINKQQESSFDSNGTDVTCTDSNAIWTHDNYTFPFA